MKKFAILFAISFLICTINALELPKRYEKILWSSNGKGDIRLRWITPPRFWPKGGWRLEDAKTGEVVKDAIKPDMSNSVLIPPKEAKEFVSFAKKILNSKIVSKQDKTAQNIFVFKTLLDFDYAKLAGFGYEIRGVKSGKHSYRLFGLKKDGTKSKLVLKSGLIDSRLKTPLPNKPLSLKAKNNNEAIQLFWKSAKKSGYGSIKYRVYRLRKDDTYKRLTNPYILTGIDIDTKKPLFTDSFAPLEKKVTYKVVSEDIFNRKSKGAKVSLFHPDPQTKKPPSNVKAKAKKGAILISWQKNDNPHTAGYLIERGERDVGFFNLLTKRRVGKNADHFVDKTAVQGVTYIYRVRTVNTRGEIGAPSMLASAKWLKKTEPKSVKGLKVKIYPSMAKLSWRKSGKNIAGYIVQKRYKSKKIWERLNSDLLIDEKFTDNFIYDAIGTVSYRVIAVGRGGKRAKPSKEVSVKLPGTLKIYPPNLLHVEGKDAKATLVFYPSKVGAKAVKYLILRGDSKDDSGMVIAEISPKKSKYTDTAVRPGEDYWYALKAVDNYGNISKSSTKLLVKIFSAHIPTPSILKAIYIKRPFRHIKLSFKKVPKYTGILVFVKKEYEDVWIKEPAFIKGGEYIYTDLPKSGKVSFKIVCKGEDGAESEASKVVSVLIR